MVKLPYFSKTKSEVVTKRFLLDANTISKVKAEVTSGCGGGDHMHKTSTAEIVIALIWRAQINAARASYGFLRTSILSVAVNLRGKTFKKIPENCCGNIFTVGTTRFEADDETTMGLNGFVDQVRGAIRNTIVEFGKQNEDDDGFFSKLIMKPCIEIAEQLRKGDVHRYPKLKASHFIIAATLHPHHCFSLGCRLRHLQRCIALRQRATSSCNRHNISLRRRRAALLASTSTSLDVSISKEENLYPETQRLKRIAMVKRIEKNIVIDCLMF
ncbi:hypothetical protein LWI28_004655 [Acer negundo]|uniref:Uncharacterized protein n=1 Tax=Acer negundo TaxID=4023 RepID=A0AAD5IY09_ACENE|nr:hypothetical protein LWI28_004655 [Acer negundo]